MYTMKIHKLIVKPDEIKRPGDYTMCGRMLLLLEARINWNEVTCKNCLKKRKRAVRVSV